MLRMSAIRGAQVKYDEVYIGTVRSISRRATKKCAMQAFKVGAGEFSLQQLHLTECSLYSG